MIKKSGVCGFVPGLLLALKSMSIFSKMTNQGNFFEIYDLDKVGPNLSFRAQQSLTPH